MSKYESMTNKELASALIKKDLELSSLRRYKKATEHALLQIKSIAKKSSDPDLFKYVLKEYPKLEKEKAPTLKAYILAECHTFHPIPVTEFENGDAWKDYFHNVVKEGYGGYHFSFNFSYGDHRFKLIHGHGKERLDEFFNEVWEQYEYVKSLELIKDHEQVIRFPESEGLLLEFTDETVEKFKLNKDEDKNRFTVNNRHFMFKGTLNDLPLIVTQNAISIIDMAAYKKGMGSAAFLKNRHMNNNPSAVIAKITCYNDLPVEKFNFMTEEKHA